MSKENATTPEALSTFDPDAFEADFWKDADNRAGWDDLEPGKTLASRPVTITKELIQRYAKAIGDENPLYFDEAYAQKTRFGGLIAPPSIHALFLFACTGHDHFMRTPGTVNMGQNWWIQQPVRPGDTITLECRCLDKLIRKGKTFAIHDNVFRNQKGEVVCSGRGWTMRPY
ncbi:MaoC family dehydratase [Thermodesulfobacteriota bacterium]